MTEIQIQIKYRLILSDRTLEFDLRFDAETMELLPNDEHQRQPWQALEVCQCTNCPLSAQESPDCPIAVNLAPLVRYCDIDSFQEVDVEVLTAERKVVAHTTIQRAISSLLGLIMATSGCPHTRPLRPMARFHLPLASDVETLYRSVSMYLLKQHFKSRSSELSAAGEAGDFALEKLNTVYEKLHIVNKFLAQRVRSACQNDAALNGIVLLDLLAKSVPMSIDDALEEIAHLFRD